MIAALVFASIAAMIAAPFIGVAVGIASGLKESRRVDRISRSFDAAIIESESRFR